LGASRRMHDKDGNGTISREEFLGLHTFLDSMRTSFEKFDLDKSGNLSPAEIESALKQAGAHAGALVGATGNV
jgi:EF hand